MTIDDETLMAFADGELPEPRFSEVAAAVETDEALAARLHALVLGKDAAKAAYGPLLAQPVPARLRRSVEAAIRANERPARRLWSPRSFQLAAAAAIAVVIAAPAGYLLGSSGTPGSIAVAGMAAPAALVAALESVPSGGEAALTGDTTMVAIATFADGAGVLCREVELLGPAAASVVVACRDGDGWGVRLAVAIPSADGFYLPAGGLDAAGTYLSAINAGPPLSPEAERAALPGISAP
ncbi:MAG: anti-sigma factor [Bauldia sp.]|nr:anti-sigma factor [Bauldia sp.]